MPTRAKSRRGVCCELLVRSVCVCVSRGNYWVAPLWLAAALQTRLMPHWQQYPVALSLMLQPTTTTKVSRGSSSRTHVIDQQQHTLAIITGSSGKHLWFCAMQCEFYCYGCELCQVCCLQLRSASIHCVHLHSHLIAKHARSSMNTHTHRRTGHIQWCKEVQVSNNSVVERDDHGGFGRCECLSQHPKFPNITQTFKHIV